MATSMPEYIFKVLLVGDATVAKTSLRGQYMSSDFQNNYNPTERNNLVDRNITVEGKLVHVMIWDVAGDERYRSTVGSYNSGAIGALVVYDVSQRKTFENVTTFIEELRERCNPNLVIVLVGNKVDSDNRAVSTVEAESFAETHHIFFMETSAMLFTTVENAFTKLFTEIFGVVSAQKLHPPHIPTDMPAEEVHEDTEGSENVEETRNSGACCPL